MHGDPYRPLPEGFPTSELAHLADTCEGWSKRKDISPDLADYYRARTEFYRAEAVIRLIEQAVA